MPQMHPIYWVCVAVGVWGVIYGVMVSSWSADLTDEVKKDSNLGMQSSPEELWVLILTSKNDMRSVF